MLSAQLSRSIRLEWLPYPRTLKEFKAAIAVGPGTLVWHCVHTQLHGSAYPDSASQRFCLKILFSALFQGRHHFDDSFLHESEIPERSFSTSLQRENSKGADQGKGDRKTLPSPATYSPMTYTIRPYNTTSIFQLRTQAALLS